VPVVASDSWRREDE